MGQVTRRGLLIGMGSGLFVATWGAPASATIVRALSLPALVQGSRRVVVMTALSSHSHYEELGRRRRIVTDTRVRIEESIAKADGVERELMVRTLGGAVGDVGELVHGQPQLLRGEPCVGFLLQGPDGLHYVNGMAQGHYPLSAASVRTLKSSPELPKILDFDSSAVKTLVGRDLGDARQLIHSLVQR